MLLTDGQPPVQDNQLPERFAELEATERYPNAYRSVDGLAPAYLHVPKWDGTPVVVAVERLSSDERDRGVVVLGLSAPIMVDVRALPFLLMQDARLRRAKGWPSDWVKAGAIDRDPEESLDIRAVQLLHHPAE
jgi:hypothetical protein